jgi:aminoglycoside phosphotransferase (APT) family kinase protein
MSQLGAVTGRHAFDTARLQAHLERHLPEFRGPIEVQQFQGGQSNPTYLLSTPAAKFVMRSNRAVRQAVAVGARDRTRVSRDARARRAGHPGAMDVVAGRRRKHHRPRVLPDAARRRSHPVGTIAAGLSKAERAAIYDEMNRVIARLHTVDIERAGLSDYGKAGNYFERQIGRWSKQYHASETESVDAMNRLIDWLPAHIPPGEETTVVHGDYRWTT